MPTGYTAGVADGEVTEFADFAMDCARAFGALITMRDDPKGAPIPDEFKPDSYHQGALDKAKERLAEVQAWDAATADEKAMESHLKALATQESLVESDQVKRERYEAMLAKVEAWTPPTPDHDEMKKFMIEQLEGSIRFDCGYIWTAPAAQTGEEFRAAEIASALHDVEYHAKHLAEDYERARQRTEWVRALRRSLAGGQEGE